MSLNDRDDKNVRLHSWVAHWLCQFNDAIQEFRQSPRQCHICVYRHTCTALCPHKRSPALPPLIVTSTYQYLQEVYHNLDIPQSRFGAFFAICQTKVKPPCINQTLPPSCKPSHRNLTQLLLHARIFYLQTTSLDTKARAFQHPHPLHRQHPLRIHLPRLQGQRLHNPLLRWAKYNPKWAARA